MCFICLFAFPLNPAVKAESLVLQKKAEFAWVKENGKKYDIGYTYNDGSGWKKEHILSTGNPVNFVPAMARGKNGDTWMVWSSDTGKQYHLYYAVVTDSNKITGPFRIKTDLDSNATPSIIFDYKNTPWIVWSGNDGGDDDIYYSMHDGNNWGKHRLVHKDNDIPDIFPQLLQENDGTLKVEWTTFNSSGMKKSTATLQQSNKSVKISPSRKLSVSDFQSQINRCVSSLPDNIDNLELATIQLNCEGNSSSVQFVGKRLK